MSAEPRRPRISVVTVALNAARDLPLTLESAIGQDYPALELLVVDGTSWDDSAAVLERYRPRIDRLIVREDAGIYPAMNAAADEASGEYVIFLNAGDQFFGAGAVSAMVRGAVDDPDVFFGNHVYVSGRREIFRRSASFAAIARRLDQGTIDHAWHASIPGHQATFTRTALLRALRYDSRLLVSADHELLFRAHAAGARMLYVDEIVAHYHAGGFSAAMGDRTRAENVSIYRRFSARPTRVDRLFYPEGSPFDPQTERTGFALAGLARAQGLPASADDLPGDRVCAAGATLMSPSLESLGLAFGGYNRIRGQRVDLTLGAERLASIDLPTGGFQSELLFSRPLGARSIVTLRPASAEPTPGVADPVGFSLRFFRFWQDGTADLHDLEPGRVLSFKASATAELMEVLGAGWDGPEESHLWSNAAESELWLATSPGVETLTLTLTGNPHVPDQRQSVQILANDVLVAQGPCDHGGRLSLEVDCRGPPWMAGRINRLAIRPSAIATPPAGSGDLRTLGVCLWRVELA